MSNTNLVPLPTPAEVEAYRLKVTTRLERLRARAEARRAEGEGRLAGARRLGDHIPFGQPILVGHHSERRHRRDIARIDDGMRAGFAALKSADELDRRADAAEANPSISSDDPEALVLLRAKLAEAEAEHAMMLKGNAAVRRCKSDDVAAAKALLALGFSTGAVTSAMRHLHGANAGYMGGKPGWNAFFTTNSNARVKAVKDRIAALERARTEAAPAPENYGGAGDDDPTAIGIEQAENRVRITFAAGKPPEAVRAELKAHGFKWAPSVGSWQRFASLEAWYWARHIVKAALAAREATS